MKRAVKTGLGLAAVLGVAAVAYAAQDLIFPPEINDLPEIVALPSADFDYRPVGKYRIGTQTVDAPLQHIKKAPAFRIMKYQVSQAEYQRCVADGACAPTETRAGDDLPQVNVNYHDAQAYAAWFSKMTKRHWRLPSAMEWQRYAAEDYVDLSFGDLNDKDDPSKRWLALYALEAKLRGDPDTKVHARGDHGENSLGVADVSANVWEWTNSCFTNAQLDKSGQTVLKNFDNCTARVAEGKHTAYIIDVVRDANKGGCAAGVPPDFLGFRLVLDP